jgi:hypothetical protein
MPRDKPISHEYGVNGPGIKGDLSSGMVKNPINPPAKAATFNMIPMMHIAIDAPDIKL